VVFWPPAYLLIRNEGGQNTMGFQCEKPFFPNTRQNGKWTVTITRQDEKELASDIFFKLANKYKINNGSYTWRMVFLFALQIECFMNCSINNNVEGVDIMHSE
jgi:hypothetical protein